MLISHLGEKGTETLAPVARALGELTSGVSFFGETIGMRARAAVRDLAPGTVLVLENLRRNYGERANNRTFAEELAALADIFVEDCFDTCHRPHASIIGVPKLLPSYAGFLLEEEVRELSRALAPKQPALAVIGGVKFNTKEAILTTLLKTYERVFVGGALANDFLKASGKDVGKSLVSETANSDDIKRILANPKLVLPIDSIIKNKIILDHGPNTVALMAELAQKAKTILWNGPLGIMKTDSPTLLKVSRARLPHQMHTLSLVAATPSPPLRISDSCRDSHSSRPAAARCSNSSPPVPSPASKLSTNNNHPSA